MPSRTGKRASPPGSVLPRAAQAALGLLLALAPRGAAAQASPALPGVGAAPADEPVAQPAPSAPGRAEDDLGTPGIPFPGEPGAAAAPPRRRLPHYEFLEDSYFDYFLPNVGPAGDEPLAFEAQAAPHLFLWNGWQKVQWQPSWSGGWIHSAAITFLLRLRMVQDRSAPVRPPSYMPRFDYQAFYVWKPQRDRVHVIELRATPWGHHSNGQQFCTFVEGDPGGIPGSQPCVTVDPRNPPTDKVNYRSGDFSTSYFIVGGHYAHLWLDDDRWERTRLSGGLLFEGNPKSWGPGTIDETTSKLYGPWRLRLDLEASHHFPTFLGWKALPGTARATASVEAIWETAPGIPGDRETIEASFLPDRTGGAGLFVRFFTGQDWMNVLFAAGRTTMVQFGVVWSLSPPLQYAFEPRPRPPAP